MDYTKNEDLAGIPQGNGGPASPESLERYTRYQDSLPELRRLESESLQEFLEENRKSGENRDQKRVDQLSTRNSRIFSTLAWRELEVGCWRKSIEEYRKNRIFAPALTS